MPARNALSTPSAHARSAPRRTRARAPESPSVPGMDVPVLALLKVRNTSDLIYCASDAPESAWRCSGFGFMKTSGNNYPPTVYSGNDADTFFAFMTCGGAGWVILARPSHHGRLDIGRLAALMHCEWAAAYGIYPDHLLVTFLAETAPDAASGPAWDAYRIETSGLAVLKPAGAALTHRRMSNCANAFRVSHAGARRAEVISAQQAKDIPYLVPQYILDAAPARPSLEAALSYGRNATIAAAAKRSAAASSPTTISLEELDEGDSDDDQLDEAADDLKL